MQPGDLFLVLPDSLSPACSINLQGSRLRVIILDPTIHKVDMSTHFRVHIPVCPSALWISY